MAFSCTSICSANDDRLRNWLSFSDRAQDSRLDCAGQHLHRGVGAEHRAAGGAIVAGAAEHRQTRHDVIAGLHIGDVGADLLDDAGGFMAEHRGQRMRIEPFHEVQVGMAEAGDRGADQDFARAGIRHADILDHQRLVDFMQDGGLHRVLPRIVIVHLFRTGSGDAAAYAAISNSPTSAMPTARSPSRWSVIARCVAFSVSRNGSPADDAMIDHHPRQQQPPGIAAHLVDAAAFPGQRHCACDMIEQAGGAPRVGLVVGPAGDLARKADGAVGEIAQAIAPGLRHVGAVVEAGMQIGGKRRVGAVAADRALQRIDRDDVAGAFPDRAEMRVAQQSRGGEFLDVADAAAHLQRIAADLSGIAGGAEFQRRRQDAQQRRGVLAAGLGAVERIGGEETHRQRLLGRQHDLHQLPPRQRQVDDAAGRTPRGSSPPSSRHDARAASARWI